MEWDYRSSDTPSPIKTEPQDTSEEVTTASERSPLQRSPLKPLICEECGNDDHAEDLLFCRGCDLVYHPFCLVPRLPGPPVGVWFCPICISKVYTCLHKILI